MRPESLGLRKNGRGTRPREIVSTLIGVTQRRRDRHEKGFRLMHRESRVLGAKEAGHTHTVFPL